MADIVLVHGGWHGGWVWRDVLPRLEAAGHRVIAPTMTGLGERRHLASEDVTPDVHVADIVNAIRWADMTDVVLVGHSYAGYIITAVAGQMPERIASLVYLDAFVPETSGECVFSAWPPERIEAIKASLKGGFLVPPSGIENWSADPETRAWLTRMATPHPIRCFTEGPALTGREREVKRRLYLWCAELDPSPFRPFYDKFRKDPDWRVAKLDCLHDAMLEVPDELTWEIISMVP